MSRVQSCRAVVILVLCLAVSGCHQGPVRSQTFVNEGSNDQVLELRREISVKMHLASFIAGGQMGTYRLKRVDGSTVGNYVREKGTLKFRPSDGGKEWSVKMQGDQSFRDEEGNLWRLTTVDEGVRQPVLHKVGG